jgi:hypothetical protein
MKKMEDIINNYRNHIRQTHEKENLEFDEAINEMVARDVMIAEAYYEAHGQLVGHLDMRLWWVFKRPKIDFGLNDIEKHWINKAVADMTDEQIESLDFPDNEPQSDRISYLINCLKDTTSVTSLENTQDAYDYLIENSPVFEQRSNELYDRVKSLPR